MKKFSEDEKMIIKKLNDLCGDVPHSLCDFLSEEFFTDCLVIFKTKEMRPSFFMQDNVYDNPKERKKKIQLFWTILTLIPYLIEENYITIVPYCTQNGNDTNLIWKFWDRKTFVFQNGKLFLQFPYYFMNGSLYKDKELIMKGTAFDEQFGEKIKKWLGDYYTLPRLSALIENDFQTEEEIRHAQTLKIAQDSLIEAKESVTVSRESLEAAKESVTISRESLEAAKESVTMSKESVDLAKTSVEQAEQSVKQAEKSVKYARWAIWVALGIGIISIIVNVLLARDNTMRIDEEQVKSLLLHNQNEINKIHDLVTKETLNVNVLNQLSKKDTFVVHVGNQLSNVDTLNVRMIKVKSSVNNVH